MTGAEPVVFCKSCGAPEEGRPTCSYCGTELPLRMRVTYGYSMTRAEWHGALAQIQQPRRRLFSWLLPEKGQG